MSLFGYIERFAYDCEGPGGPERVVLKSSRVLRLRRREWRVYPGHDEYEGQP